MNSLKKYPCELIEKTCNDFCDNLWNLSETKCRHFAYGLDSFQEEMRDFIIQNLTIHSLVESETIELTD